MNKPDMDPTYFDVVIIGGGLAGLIASIELGRAGCKVALIEKKQYPFHKVCGEYVSNEVLPYLKQTGFDPHRFGASSISRLLVTAPNGRRFFAPLQSGGFGISRFRMDNHLVQLTREAGVHVMEGTRVMNAAFLHNQFELTLNNGSVIQCGLALGCYGKRDSLDKKLDRGFINKRTGYLGVKYHIHADLPADEIALHNFKGGYCGVVKIEDDKFNLCYLRKAAGNSKPQSLDELEATVLAGNPVLKDILQHSVRVGGPVAINEICFAQKELVKDHILMCGDAAGLITPLCGNGMAMAITSGMMLGRLIAGAGIWKQKQIPAGDRERLEQAYIRLWKKEFSKRLFWGRTIQSFFGNPALTGTSLEIINALPLVRDRLIQATHGKLLLAPETAQGRQVIHE